MQILPHEPAMADDIAGAYNNVILGVPHCYPVCSDELAAAVAPTDGGGDGPERLHSETALVARDGAAVRGFAHTAVERPAKEGDAERGIIRFFWYERGHRSEGQALLDAAEEHLRGSGMDEVIACHQDYRYRFYHLCHAHLSDHLGHVQALLGLNGYRRCAGEVFLDWENYEPIEPESIEATMDISVEWREGRGERPNLCVQAHQDGKDIGVCSSVSCGEFSDAEEAQDWFITVWLGVEDDLQGQGRGRHLLRRALKEMHAVGYRHAAISTNWQNYRALLFYSNFGYRVVDWTYAFRKRLSASQ